MTIGFITFSITTLGHFVNQQNDTQHNATQQNAAQHNETRPYNIQRCYPRYNDTQHNNTEHNEAQASSDTQHDDDV